MERMEVAYKVDCVSHTDPFLRFFSSHQHPGGQLRHPAPQAIAEDVRRRALRQRDALLLGPVASSRTMASRTIVIEMLKDAKDAKDALR
jgi:hypothetical protein